MAAGPELVLLRERQDSCPEPGGGPGLPDSRLPPASVSSPKLCLFYSFSRHRPMPCLRPCVPGPLSPRVRSLFLRTAAGILLCAMGGSAARRPAKDRGGREAHILLAAAGGTNISTVSPRGRWPGSQAGPSEAHRKGAQTAESGGTRSCS